MDMVVKDILPSALLSRSAAQSLPHALLSEQSSVSSRMIRALVRLASGRRHFRRKM